MSLARAVWTRLPRGARREALFGGAALLAPRPAWPEPRGDGPVVVAGFLAAPSGLGEGARRMLDAMRAQGLDARGADLTGPLRQGSGRETPGPAPVVPAGPGTLVLHVNGPMLPWALLSLGRRAVRGKRVVAYWAWELPLLPRDWNRGYRACHRVWTPSRWCAAVFARPGTPAPLVVPHPVPTPEPSPLGRGDFGLPADAFAALCLFDASSSLARKNPLGAIEAHRRAFGDDPRRLLVIKTHGTDRAGGAWAPVAAAAAARPNVRVIDAALPRRDLWALMGCCDALLSLHRAEGYGLVIAEATALGVPVVATGWSGSADLLDAPGCVAVPSTPVPARDPQEIYHLPGACWAEPDLDAAAAALRGLAESPSPRRPWRPAPPDYRAALAIGRPGG